MRKIRKIMLHTLVCAAAMGWCAADAASIINDHDRVAVPLSVESLGEGVDTIVIEGEMSLTMSASPDGDGLGLRLSLPAGSVNAVVGVGRRGGPIERVGLTLLPEGVFESTPLEPPSPDIDRDGVITGNDMRLLILALWRRCFCREDANRDGSVDPDDIRFVGDALHMSAEDWWTQWLEWTTG